MDGQNVTLEKRTHIQWRSEVPPGADHKSAALSTPKFAYKNLKSKKIIFRAYLKIQGLIKHLQNHNHTLTN